MAIDTMRIIERYYTPGTPLYDVLVTHSRQVAELTLTLCRRLESRGVAIDTEFAFEAAMLHDIGICRVDAPSIHCHGTERYICHGILGREMLDSIGLPRHGLVCERHTGTGITRQQIERPQLPLPPADYVPVTEEEQIVCYADKFYSKSHPDRVLTVEQTAQSLARFGQEGVEKFMAWASRYE